MNEVIPGALDGERVDRAIALVTGLTRAEVAALVESGGVRVDGRVVAVRSRRVRAGQHLEVTSLPVPTPKIPVAGEAGIAVDVVFEDDQLLVIDKPAGLVVHPGAGNRAGTLVQGLMARYPELAKLTEVGAEERPGIVHRLDKGTSGLLVVARTAAARAALKAQLAAHEMARSYATVVIGTVESDDGVIDAPLGRATRDHTRIVVHAAGRSARTHYRVERRFTTPAPLTQLTCTLETGRTHQIRVHLDAIGHPVLGDERYGRERAAVIDGWRPLPKGRPFLHAVTLGLRHPTTGLFMSWESPLPDDLVEVIGRLA